MQGSVTMTKWLQKKAVFVCTVCILCALLSGYAAVDRDTMSNDGAAYEKLSVYVDGTLEYTGYMVNGVAYVPLRSFCSALDMGAVVTWNAASGVISATVQEAVITETIVESKAIDSDDPEAEPVMTQHVVVSTSYRSHTLSAKVGEFYLTVNDRVLYLGGDVLNYRGNVLVPLNGLCRAFNITAVSGETESGLNLHTEDLQVVRRGSEVYNATDLKWLSHIINAEAGNQSLEGQICVGNVVLNRVRDARFPDTVQEVIFSPNQFCPVTSGSIYCTPDEDAVIAAKLCLEGVNLAGECTYFVNPTTGVTAWFRNNLTYAMSVGDHDFYY